MKQRQPKREKKTETAVFEEKRSKKSLRRARFRKKQLATSMYFLLWAIFSALSLLIVLFSALMQRYVFVQSYKEQAARDLLEKAQKIESTVHSAAPEWTGDNLSGYLRFLSREYDLRIYVLNEDGVILLPQEPNFNPEAPEVEEMLDFSAYMEELLHNLSESGGTYALYESSGEYIYASALPLFQNVKTYLFIGQSLDLLHTTLAQMNVRVVLISVFVFVLSFAVTSALSGWLTTPISEMTKKTHRLAQGDFDVDFHGSNYSKEMVELAEALNYARDELSKTDHMQKELIANISHDFKTPLTMIKAYASMIMEISGDVPEKRNKHAQVIVDEADRLASLVNDVLDLSKISSGIEVLQRSSVDMSAYVYEILDRFAYLREQGGYTFEVDVDGGLVTIADELKIGQALYNLIGNAVNYTGEDKKVFVSLKNEGEYFRFAVTDTGKGIKAEELSNIWERYYRSSEIHKRPVQGTGLGLSIVKTILERHGFAFGVDSNVGAGSTFYVLFPLIEND